MVQTLLKNLLLAIGIVLVLAQFFGPEKNNGDADSVTAFLQETNANAEATAILKSSCFDCHSSSTTYPWYNNITPVNYWLADHVKDGKRHFNVSNWSDYSNKKKDHKLEELIEEVEEQEMPLPSYTLTHGDLSSEEINTLISWAKSARLNYAFEGEAQ